MSSFSIYRSPRKPKPGSIAKSRSGIRRSNRIDLLSGNVLWPRVILAGACHMNPKPASSIPVPRILIVGAGFGGLAVAKQLGSARASVTVIDRRNFHLFQPLLYQVATAALSPADIAVPIRSLLRDQSNTRVLLDEVVAVESVWRAKRALDRRRARL